MRTLYDSVPELSHEDEQVRGLLRAPAGSQFFVVRAANSEQLLQREEALTKLLSERQQRGKVLGWQALSDQVPSRQTQEAHRSLLAERVYAPAGQAERLFTALEDEETLVQARSLFAAQQRTLSLEEWLQSPLSAPVRHLFLASSPQTLSIVLLRGTPTGADLAELSALGQRLQGVTWVDQVADISQVLGGFRRALSWMLPIGYTLVALCLVWFYGKSSWRVSAPAALASLVALGIPALFGQPVTLFDLLALVLVLGMGVDYGIFMNEPRGAGFGVAFLSVSLGAASTLLSFGLLACSGTPALSNFGLTLLIGIGISWFLTPCFAKYSREPEARANQQGEAAHAN